MHIPLSPKVIILIFVVILVSIPTGALLIKQRMDAQTAVNQAYTGNVTQGHDVPSVSPIKDIVNNSTPTSGATAANDQSGSQVSYGPSLSFSVILEGRPADMQQGKVFVGIAPGKQTNNPQYILSYTVNVPSSGQYSNLSIVGLTQGASYTAYVKGPSQLVKAIPFNMTPNGVMLNSGTPIQLISGDLNEDNKIDDADYQIAKGLLGQTPSSQKWNSNADFNLDNIINTWDLGIITQNLGKTGDGGPWYSRIDQTASNSAQINQPSNIGGANSSFTPYQHPTGGGYWLWVPSSN